MFFIVGISGILLGNQTLISVAGGWELPLTMLIVLAEGIFVVAIAAGRDDVIQDQEVHTT